VTAAGARGQVTRADVASAHVPEVPATSAADPREIRVPVKGIRRHIAEATVTSAFTAPHVTEWLTIDVTRTLSLLARLRAENPAMRLRSLTLLARPTLLSLARHPEIKARWDDATAEIVRCRDINLGIAVASPRGLIVPNIPAAQDLNFHDLGAAMDVLIKDGRANRTTAERMTGGTFTISNVGVFGVDGATGLPRSGRKTASS
jgi:2-oxoisovalerate dehydrogenase E2 component (dihydrolipoyl transacylase)